MSQKNPKPEPQKNPSTTELATKRTDLAERRTELAKFRNRAAADRTLMAWMRTCLSLIGFGFGIPTLVYTLQKSTIGQDMDLKPERASIILGLAFITTGLFGMSTALMTHYRMLKSIAEDNYTYDNKVFDSTAIASVALLCIGLVSFIAVVIQILV
ncbi:MAG: DUF202 domain-containing protein [Pleurocapsa sp. MO_226.B13]|nr:DUF202 domain-containing protein [Pleurocapsa sp. MO_226.B13]